MVFTRQQPLFCCGRIVYEAAVRQTFFMILRVEMSVSKHHHPPAEFLQRLRPDPADASSVQPDTTCHIVNAAVFQNRKLDNPALQFGEFTQ